MNNFDVRIKVTNKSKTNQGKSLSTSTGVKLDPNSKYQAKSHYSHLFPHIKGQNQYDYLNNDVE